MSEPTYDLDLEHAIVGEVDRSIPFIDAHHHLWELGRFRYDWLVDEPRPDGTIGPVADYTPVLGDYRMIRQDWPVHRLLKEFYGSNVVRSVHIEASYAGPDAVEETTWLDSVAEAYGFPNALVVFVDVERPGAEAAIERHLDASARVRGIRPRGHPAEWQGAAFREAMTALGRRGLSYELNASPGVLPAGRAAAAAFPDTQVILGHAGFPLERTRQYFDQWRAEMSALAEVPSVACKVSGFGMVDHTWSVDSITPWVLHCIDAFGPDRIMFGTNWPVDVVHSSYLRQVDAYRWIIARAGFSRAEQESMLHHNAERFYRLGGGELTVDRLTLGVIGAGTWAIAAHLPAFANRPDVEPLIVCRRDAARLDAVKQKFGFARATTDWREVIDARPDLVVLTGPVGMRAEQARAAIEAGAHVLAEKPFTVSPQDAWDLSVLARQRASTLMICYGWNEMAIVETARNLLRDDGGVGTVEHVTAVMASGVRDLLTTGDAYLGSAEESPPRLETWGDPQVSGGGYGQGQLTHGLGILFRLLDVRATDVMAFTNHPGGSAVELYDAIALRLEGGITGTVSGAALRPRVFAYHHQMQITVSGSDGQLQLDLDRPMIRRSRANGEDIVADIPESDASWSFQRVIDRFVSLAKGEPGVENRSPGELGARVVEVLDAMTRSAESEASITIR